MFAVAVDRCWKARNTDLRQRKKWTKGPSVHRTLPPVSPPPEMRDDVVLSSTTSTTMIRENQDSHVERWTREGWITKDMLHVLKACYTRRRHKEDGQTHTLQTCVARKWEKDEAANFGQHVRFFCFSHIFYFKLNVSDRLRDVVRDLTPRPNRNCYCTTTKSIHPAVKTTIAAQNHLYGKRHDRAARPHPSQSEIKSTASVSREALKTFKKEKISSHKTNHLHDRPGRNCER